MINRFDFNITLWTLCFSSHLIELPSIKATGSCSGTDKQEYKKPNTFVFYFSDFKDIHLHREHPFELTSDIVTLLLTKPFHTNLNMVQLKWNNDMKRILTQFIFT